jgi:hypothetical protein
MSVLGGREGGRQGGEGGKGGQGKVAYIVGDGGGLVGGDQLTRDTGGSDLDGLEGGREGGKEDQESGHMKPCRYACSFPTTGKIGKRQYDNI